jgi:glycosyltransferase involved in cell wall biosynthesis
MPSVSVIIPSYNHERFVAECINSVLNQTFQDFEIIITDDASTDRTVEIIERFDDPRIKLFKHSKNQGVSVAANNCIRHASGKYISWLSTDDAWYPEKLELQVRYLDEHSEVGVIFGKADWIDEAGNLITDSSFPYLNIFNVPNRPRVEWLRHFFLVGNCLSLPCSLIRKECFEKVGMFDPRYAKIPDLDLWIRICFEYDIVILDRKLIRNRWIGDESNASGSTIRNRIQVQFEHRHSLNHYLRLTVPDELLSIFPDSTKYGRIAKGIIPYFLGRIAIENGWHYKILWGLDVISDLLQNENAAQALEENCNFTYRDFIDISSQCDSSNLEALETLAQKEQAIKTSMIQLDERQQTIQILSEEVHRLGQELKAIKNSRSWRYVEFFKSFWGNLH